MGKKVDGQLDDEDSCDKKADAEKILHLLRSLRWHELGFENVNQKSGKASEKYTRYTVVC